MLSTNYNFTLTVQPQNNYVDTVITEKTINNMSKVVSSVAVTQDVFFLSFLNRHNKWRSNVFWYHYLYDFPNTYIPEHFRIHDEPFDHLSGRFWSA